MLTDNFIGSISFYPLGTFIPCADMAVDVQKKNGIILYRIHHQPKALLPFQQFQLCLFFARTAMSAATFNQLYQKARNHFFQSSTVSDVQSAFTNTANYFSTEQVRQMLLLVKAEADRLALAKLAYSRTVDANNFSQLGDLFTTQANKEELASFIRSRQGY